MRAVNSGGFTGESVTKDGGHNTALFLSGLAVAIEGRFHDGPARLWRSVSDDDRGEMTTRWVTRKKRIRSLK